MLSSHNPNSASLQEPTPLQGPTAPLRPSQVDAPQPVRRSTQPTAGRRDIARTVSERLAESAYFALRSVWCDYHEGILCLRGRVPSYFLKQVAQTIAGQVDGVEECMNRIEVSIPASLPPPASR
jgi:osmotically-inducible protein OsmY